MPSKSPSPLATINYDPNTLNTSVAAYSPPTDKDFAVSTPPIPGSVDLDTLVRVGFYDTKAGLSTWSGTVTHASSFNPKHQHQLSLSLYPDGELMSVSFNAFAENIDPREERRRQKREERQRKREEEAIAKGKEPMSKAGRAAKKKNEKKREQPMVEVVKMKPAPLPILNKPVQIDANTGKVPEPEQKTFLQKYWWAIAIFLVLQLVAGVGGGGDSGGK